MTAGRPCATDRQPARFCHCLTPPWDDCTGCHIPFTHWRRRQQPITTFSDESFQPAEAGPPATVLDVDEGGDVVDEVAFYACDPGRWWLRYGIGIALGMDAFDKALRDGAPLRVVATPADWLGARGDALCVLDWRTNLYSLLSPARAVVCDDAALASRIICATARPHIQISIRSPR